MARTYHVRRWTAGSHSALCPCPSRDFKYGPSLRTPSCSTTHSMQRRSSGDVLEYLYRKFLQLRGRCLFVLGSLKMPLNLPVAWRMRTSSSSRSIVLLGASNNRCLQQQQEEEVFFFFFLLFPAWCWCWCWWIPKHTRGHTLVDWTWHTRQAGLYAFHGPREIQVGGGAGAAERPRRSSFSP